MRKEKQFIISSLQTANCTHGKRTNKLSHEPDLELELADTETYCWKEQARCWHRFPLQKPVCKRFSDGWYV
jgi:hypothetical protein